MSHLASLHIVEEENVFVASLEGEVDLSNAGLFRERLADSIPNSAEGLVIDLTDIQYLDSSGIHLLFDVASQMQKRQQQLRVAISPESPIRQVLEMVGVQHVMDVHSTREEALASVQTRLS